ncbi:unnamed protein product [Symbiodinium sp. CCMP2592]|nr:unnamed protein product [Symbiodinium sp. CCMP2592]
MVASALAAGPGKLKREEWKLQAVAFARLVSKMSVELDSTGQAPSEVPVAELPPPKPAFGGAGKGLAPGQRVPSHRYLYFMPPGQPGEKRLAMYPAMWLRQLTTSRWVPGTEGGTGVAPKRGWFKPCEVLLKSDPSKPGLPVADLPPDVVRSLGEAFKTLFAWGTVAPEAPVERLEAVGAAARNQAGSEAPEPLWRAVCNAHRLGTLKPVQRQKLKQLASLPVFPAPPDLLDGADRLALSRLVRPATGASQDQAEEIKALVDAKWLVDVRSPDWPLRDVVDDVAALVDFSPMPSKACMEGLVSWCCVAEPGSLSEELRTAFSHAMAALVDEASKSPLPPTEALKKLLPDLKLFCKASDEGVFLRDGCPSPRRVVPVLNDDSAKAAMLTPAQSLQLLGAGVLDHPRSHFPSAARLQAKDARVIAALGVLRLSDPAVSLQTRISGEAKLVPGSSQRIGLVLKLLWRSAGKEFSTNQVEVSLRKCDAIGRELSLHSGDKASRMEAFAIWGEADPEDQSRYDLLVAGDPDDYVAEVEELFESRFEMVFRACETRPAKVLRLLRHLESERDFNKFLARDFAGVLEQEELERRKSEAKAKVAEQQAARAADTARAEAAARQAAAADAEAAKRAKAEASRKAEAEEAAAKAAEQARQAELAEFLEAAKAAKARREAKAAEAKAGTETKAPTFVPATLPTGPSTTAAPTACPVPGAPATAASEVAAAAPVKPKGMVVAARFPAKPVATSTMTSID